MLGGVSTGPFRRTAIAELALSLSLSLSLSLQREMRGCYGLAVTTLCQLRWISVCAVSSECCANASLVGVRE